MSGDSADHDADLCESQLAQCEICGASSADEVLDDHGWGAFCLVNPECRAPLGPRQREVKSMTAAELDDLEERLGNDWYTGVRVAELRWLIDCARQRIGVGR